MSCTFSMPAVLSAIVLMAFSDKPVAAPEHVSRESKPVVRELPRVDEVRALLGSRCGLEAMKTYPLIMELGTDAFPAFEVIIADPKSQPKIVASAFGHLSEMQTDRRRFVPLVISRLQDPSGTVRRYAVRLLEQIGSERDTERVVALLPACDRDCVGYYAARTLAKIGGKRDLDAMDEWLKNGKHPKDGDYMIHVKKCRDELEKRLKDNPIPKTLMN